MSTPFDFLFQLYTEEIPSFYQLRLIEDWQKRLESILSEKLLEFSGVHVSGTSRRLYVLISGLKGNQKTEKKKLKGPPEGICLKDNKPTPALEGFAKKANVEISEIIFEEIDGGKYATANSVTGGEKSIQILSALFADLIRSQTFPRNMRWGNLEVTYARPILSYTVIYGKDNIEFEGEFWKIIPCKKNIPGHFILGPKEISLKESSDFEKELASKGIVANHIDRKKQIEEMLDKAAGKDSVIKNNDLLDEVNFLVERPCVIRGKFPDAFLEMPDIVILSEMQEHQKYFGLRNTEGKLLNEFLIVANADSSDSEALNNIRLGNEKVLRARLCDGVYFFNEDRKRKISDRVDDLKRIVFHESMGNIFDKKERIKQIALLFKDFIYPDLKFETLFQAADLIKADLTTHLVYEFDHLQGQIGSIYAGYDKEDEEVAVSIFEHYLPRNVNDEFPSSLMGILLSISDKFDNIVSGHVLGKQPTSSQDPLGLRRQTLYVIDMLIQNKISLSLSAVLKPVIELYKEYFTKENMEKSLLEQILDFFMGRLATIFEKDGFDKKLVNAALGTGNDNLFELHMKLTSLKSFKEDENFLLMMSAFKRMNNIVTDFLAKNPKGLSTIVLDPGLFKLAQEKKLYEIAEKLSDLIKKSGVGGEASYDDIFLFLASVKKDIDDFFDNVMVMDDDKDIRLNRLALLLKNAGALKSVINVELLQ